MDEAAALPTLAFTIVGAMGLIQLYLTRPRCPECASIRAVMDVYDDDIRICRDCHTIYRVSAS